MYESCVESSSYIYILIDKRVNILNVCSQDIMKSFCTFPASLQKSQDTAKKKFKDSVYYSFFSEKNISRGSHIVLF